MKFNSDLQLFKFYQSYGRMGDLEALFFATQEDVDALLGKEIYLGEVLGKHSDVHVDIGPNCIERIDLDLSAREALFAATGQHLSGIGLLEQYAEQLGAEAWERNNW